MQQFKWMLFVQARPSAPERRRAMHLRCVECAAQYTPDLRYACELCGGILEVREPEGIQTEDPYLRASMWRYGPILPVSKSSSIVSLGEGLTPLHRAARLAQAISGFDGELWLKDETVNPTGSFKDRHISVAVSRARELGIAGIVCASSGNAGASASAYAARAGLPAVIIVPTATPMEKLTQIAAYGAVLLKVDGHYSNSYQLAQELADRHQLANLTTTYVNPYGTAALNTVAHEIFEQLDGRAPDHVLVPTGAGPLVKGVVQGFRDNAPGCTPRVVAVQAEGCAPIVRAFECGESTVEAWGTPATIASGISDPLLGYEGDGAYTLRLTRETGGLAVAVRDETIVEAMRALAHLEGVLAEPTGASSVAGLMKLADLGRVPAGSRIVCLITGHGFKDFNIFREMPARVFHLDRVQARREIEEVIEGLVGGCPSEHRL
jgi:threonine synthase